LLQIRETAGAAIEEFEKGRSRSPEYPAADRRNSSEVRESLATIQRHRFERSTSS
jgi:hypothetical protein